MRRSWQRWNVAKRSPLRPPSNNCAVMHSSARASRWKNERRIFSVQWNGIDYYPAFQFSPKSGEPLSAMQTILNIFGDTLREWQIAIWFFANNGSLAGARRPMEVIARDPKAVIEAAKHEVEPFSG